MWTGWKKFRNENLIFQFILFKKIILLPSI